MLEAINLEEQIIIKNDLNIYDIIDSFIIQTENTFNDLNDTIENNFDFELNNNTLNSILNSIENLKNNFSKQIYTEHDKSNNISNKLSDNFFKKIKNYIMNNDNNDSVIKFINSYSDIFDKYIINNINNSFSGMSNITKLFSNLKLDKKINNANTTNNNITNTPNLFNNLFKNEKEENNFVANRNLLLTEVLNKSPEGVAIKWYYNLTKNKLNSNSNEGDSLIDNITEGAVQGATRTLLSKLFKKIPFINKLKLKINTKISSSRIIDLIRKNLSVGKITSGLSKTIAKGASGAVKKAGSGSMKGIIALLLGSGLMAGTMKISDSLPKNNEIKNTSNLIKEINKNKDISTQNKENVKKEENKNNQSHNYDTSYKINTKNENIKKFKQNKNEFSKNNSQENDTYFLKELKELKDREDNEKKIKTIFDNNQNENYNKALKETSENVKGFWSKLSDFFKSTITRLPSIIPTGGNDTDIDITTEPLDIGEFNREDIRKWLKPVGANTSWEKIEKLNSSLLAKLIALGKKTGTVVPITEGFRTYEDQEKLYNSKPKGMAARPGHSKHEKGNAVDISSNFANKYADILTEVGLIRPIKGEAWHVEEAKGFEGVKVNKTFTDILNKTEEAKNQENKVIADKKKIEETKKQENKVITDKKKINEAKNQENKVIADMEKINEAKNQENKIVDEKNIKKYPNVKTKTIIESNETKNNITKEKKPPNEQNGRTLSKQYIAEYTDKYALSQNILTELNSLLNANNTNNQKQNNETIKNIENSNENFSQYTSNNYNKKYLDVDFSIYLNLFKIDNNNLFNQFESIFNI